MLSVPIAIFGAFLGLYLRHYDLDVFRPDRPRVLIGLAPKRDPDREFSKTSSKRGRSLVDAALEGARVRPPADSDDVVRIHPRRGAAVDCQQ